MWRITLLLAVLVICCAGFAQENEQTRALDAEIARAQEILRQQEAEAAQLERELANLSSEIRSRVQERDRVSQQLVALRQEREALQRDVQALETQLLETQEEIVWRTENIRSLEERIQGLLLNLHRQRAGRYARVLAQAETFHDFEVKNYYLSLLTQQDVALINELAQEVAAFAEAQDRQMRQKRELEAKEAQLAENERQLEGTRAQLSQTINQLESTQEGRQVLRQESLDEQRRLRNTIAQTERNLERVRQQLIAERDEAQRRAREATEARERQIYQQQVEQAEQRIQTLTELQTAPTPSAPTAPSSPTTPTTRDTPPPVATVLPVPTSGAEFAHPFPNPKLFSGYSADQTYVVLQAERSGSAVQAVKAGVVELAQFHTANVGYMVIIRHDAELATIYQNLQQPVVRPGDRVSQGQVIGALGGGSLYSGDMLRFFVGIQRGNTRTLVNPAPRLGFE